MKLSKLDKTGPTIGVSILGLKINAIQTLPKIITINHIIYSETKRLLSDSINIDFTELPILPLARELNE